MEQKNRPKYLFHGYLLGVVAMVISYTFLALFGMLLFIAVIYITVTTEGGSIWTTLLYLLIITPSMCLLPLFVTVARNPRKYPRVLRVLVKRDKIHKSLFDPRYDRDINEFYSRPEVDEYIEQYERQKAVEE